MSIDALSAANAYRSQLKLQSDITDTPLQEEANKSSFSNLVKEGLESAIGAQNKSESMKIDSLTIWNVNRSD